MHNFAGEEGSQKRMEQEVEQLVRERDEERKREEERLEKERRETEEVCIVHPVCVYVCVCGSVHDYINGHTCGHLLRIFVAEISSHMWEGKERRQRARPRMYFSVHQMISHTLRYLRTYLDVFETSW
jgi:hypothetical protein